jgi:hypothetical protein
MDRREILAAIQKGTIERNVGGQLNPEQAKAFIQEVQEKSAFGSAIGSEQRTAPKGTVDKMGNGSRLVRGRKENTDDGYRAGISTDEIEYDAKDLWLPFEVTEDFFHENIEGQSAEAKILNRMTRQFALDLDDLNINGDEEDADAFVGLDDGLIKLATASTSTHHVEGAKVKSAEGKELGGAMAKELFFQLKYAMPNKYVNSGGLRWLMSPNRWTTWIEYLTNRQTGAGDAALMAKELWPLGIPPFVGYSSDESAPMPGIAAWPDDLIMLADLSNFTRVITWDIQRYRVTGDTDWELATRRKRGYVFFIKQDFIVQEDDAVAYCDELSAITA